MVKKPDSNQATKAYDAVAVANNYQCSKFEYTSAFNRFGNTVNGYYSLACAPTTHAM